MAITIGPAAHKAVQAQSHMAQSQQAQGKSAKSDSDARPQADRDSSVALKSALTPAIKQVAQLAAGPIGEVAVKMAVGAVGALLDTKA